MTPCCCEAQAEADPEARAALYQQVSQMIHDDYLYIFHTHTLWDIAYRDGVNGPCSRTSPEGVELRCQIAGRTFFSSIWMDQ